MLVLISVFSYILLIIILIVFSKGTMVNSDTTSNDTIWYPGGVFHFFSVDYEWFTAFDFDWDWPSCFNIWTKYFASSYIAVLVF